MIAICMEPSKLGKAILVDTSAFVALHNRSDSLHARAAAVARRYASDPAVHITSNYILAETVTMLSQRASHSIAVDFYERAQTDLLVMPVTPAIEASAFAIFKSLRSKNVSFVDCTSFALMREFHLHIVFTFDKDFKKQGFQLLT